MTIIRPPDSSDFVDRQHDKEAEAFISELFDKQHYVDFLEKMRAHFIVTRKKNSHTGEFEDGITIGQEHFPAPDPDRIITELAPHVERIKQYTNPIVVVLPAAGAVKTKGIGHFCEPGTTIVENFAKKSSIFGIYYPTNATSDHPGGMTSQEYQETIRDSIFPGWHIVVCEHDLDTSPENYDEFPVGAAVAPGYLKLTADQTLMLHTIYGLAPKERHIVELVSGQMRPKSNTFPALARVHNQKTAGNEFDLLSLRDRDLLGQSPYGKSRQCVFARRGFNLDSTYEHPMPTSRIRRATSVSVENAVARPLTLQSENAELRERLTVANKLKEIAEDKAKTSSQKAAAEAGRARGEKERANYAFSKIRELEDELAAQAFISAQRKRQIGQLELEAAEMRVEIRNLKREKSKAEAPRQEQTSNEQAYCGFTEAALRKVERTQILQKIRKFVVLEYHPDKFPPEQREQADRELALFNRMMDKILEEKEASSR